MNSLKKEFSTFTLVLIPVAIAINIAVGQLVLNLKLPLYLDSIGTVLVGVLIGPWAGAATGFLANVVWTFSGLFPQAMAWAGVAAIIGALAGVFGRAGLMKSVGMVVVAGLITGVVAAVLSAPIAAYVFGGVTGSGTDAVVAVFRAAGLDALGANLAQGGVSEPFDKIATFLIVWAVMLGLPERLKARFAAE
ncbi:MAG: ECF transporter S component [Chloroflexi bacterium]|nr:ECF transporter S component [Chloroflexota bacterium]MQC26350.1 ECF transporter S component [Chloroflexota bacterium]